MTLKPSPETTHPTSTAPLSVSLRLSTSEAASQIPLTTGVCFPQSALMQAFSAMLSGASVRQPVQLDVLNRWADGSVRWALLSTVIPEVQSGTTELKLSDFSAQPAEACRVTTRVQIEGEQIRIAALDLSANPPIHHTIRLTPRLSDAHGHDLPLMFQSVQQEVGGFLRQVVCVDAVVASLAAIQLRFRITHWPESGLIQCETRIRNTRRAHHAGGLWDLGDPGSFCFGSLELGVQSDELPASSELIWKAEPDVAGRSTHGEVFLMQYGSGSRAWRSTSHLTADAEIPVRERGYVATFDAGSLRGYQASPIFQLQSSDAHLLIGVPEFWQNFPSGIGAAMGTLEFALFPRIPGVIHELQGGEQKTQQLAIKYGTGQGTPSHLHWTCHPVSLVQSAESVAAARVIPWFTSRHADTGHDRFPADCPGQAVASRFHSYLQNATTGRFALQERRSSIDEYGWRNFGDVPADHEQTHYAGSNTIVSHYNNQFDMIFGGILQWLSTGDSRWRDLFCPLARHVMDIDIYHTRQDRAAFNGGLFWHTDHYVDARTCTHRTYSVENQKPGKPYGGGPSCEHNYTTGLLHYYFLTGHPEARESVLSLANWVIAMDDGQHTLFGLLDDGPTGAASATVFEDFHGPGRGAGNSVNALLDAWILTGSDQYLSKLEELIRRCVSPSQNPDDLHLLDAEGHWSYTVFLTALGRYLAAKRDAGLLDSMYSWAHEVLCVYGRWMADHEHRTLDHPDRLQYPTEAWAAQDFRKCNVMRLTASVVDDGALAEQLRNRANEIHEAAWRDLAAFGSAQFTARCLSILMTEGHREVFHRCGGAESFPKPIQPSGAGSWSMFVPQKARVRQILRSPGQLMAASLKALRPLRIRNAVRAAMRQFF